MTRRGLLAGLLVAGLRARGASPPATRFADITSRCGVRFENNPSHTSQKYLLETMGGGVAMFDYDNDGYLDLFFVNGAHLDDPMPPGKRPDKSDTRYWNRLYHNNRDGTFTDVTEAAGVKGHSYGMGVAAGDYNNDGHTDFYVTNYGTNILYRNNGDGTFSDVTDAAGVGGGGWSAGACWVDYDRDGWLDLIVSRYVQWDFSQNIWCGDRRPGYRSYCHPDHFKPIAHIVYHNNRDGTFSDVSRAAGFEASPGKGLGIAFNDFDGDGWPDILIANDSFPQQLFHNLRDGTFKEIGVESGIAYDEDGHTFAGMGVDFADYDNDGMPDAFVNALGNQRYAVFRNVKGMFEYVSGQTSVATASMLHSGWGAGFVDLDNDGWKDLFVGQGHVMDNIELTQPSLRYKEPLLLMKNNRGKFQDVTSQSGPPFTVPLAARGVAFGDLNNDGRIDIAINCNNQPAVILQNTGAGQNHWLLINTIGKKSNRDGIGARIKVVGQSGAEQHGIVSTAGSYLSSSDKRVHFGLGQDSVVKLIEISWPSGTVQKIENTPADRILTVTEPAR